MTFEDFKNNTLAINEDTVSRYEKMFKTKLPTEVKNIISQEDGKFLYNNKEYILMSPEVWLHRLDFLDYNFNKSGYIPLLFYDYIVVCYYPKEEVYFFKELGLGMESDDYKSLAELLNAHDSIITEDIKKVDNAD
jgi:hypothetical protein